MRNIRLISIPGILFESVEGGESPTAATAGSAGLDARAWIKNRRIKFYSDANQPYELKATTTELLQDWSVALAPHHRALVPLGFKARLPEGYEAQCRARSGLAWKHGLALVNGIGTIDEDFPDEWACLLENRSTIPFRIEHGMRICQLVISHHASAMFDWIPSRVERTTKRAGGYGSTGT
jgi:dUTP pyrophosphatase